MRGCSTPTIQFDCRRIERAPFETSRRVIDVSGDGDDDNSGGDVTVVRDKVLSAGITINALVVFNDQPVLWENGLSYPTANLTGALFEEEMALMDEAARERDKIMDKSRKMLEELNKLVERIWK